MFKSKKIVTCDVFAGEHETTMKWREKAEKIAKECGVDVVA